MARPRPTALLSPSSDGKPEAATVVVVAPDDGHEDARNMLSCSNSIMYVVVRIQLYIIWYMGSYYYQLHVSASILAIIRFTLRFNL
jgi:hypothetical protein